MFEFIYGILVVIGVMYIDNGNTSSTADLVTLGLVAMVFLNTRSHDA